jgi:hypothetical protein
VWFQVECLAKVLKLGCKTGITKNSLALQIEIIVSHSSFNIEHPKQEPKDSRV